MTDISKYETLKNFVLYDIYETNMSNTQLMN